MICRVNCPPPRVRVTRPHGGNLAVGRGKLSDEVDLVLFFWGFLKNIRMNQRELRVTGSAIAAATR